LIVDVREKILQQPFKTDPFLHFVVKDLFPLEFQKFIKSEYKKDKMTKRNYNQESMWQGMSQGELFDFFALDLAPILQEKFKSKTLIKLENQGPSFKKDRPWMKLQRVHRDVWDNIKGRSFTFQYFFGVVDRPDGGTILHNKKRKPVVELPLINNSCTVFENTEDSYHSVAQRGYDRNSVLVRFKEVDK
jgi:hypothetical protein